MEVYRAAYKVRELILCHDRAVQQILFLDKKIAELKKRQAKLTNENEWEQTLNTIIDQRISITEYIKDMYHAYRFAKWEHILMYANALWEGIEPTDTNDILALSMIAYSDSFVMENQTQTQVYGSLLDEEMEVDIRVQ